MNLNDINVYDNMLCRAQILSYIISKYDIYKVCIFVNAIQYKMNLCNEEFDYKYILWTEIVKNKDLLILDYFIDSCDICAWDAFDTAINNNCTFAAIHIIENGFHDCLNFPHFLKCILLENNYLLNFINTNENIREFIYFNGVSYLNLLESSLEKDDSDIVIIDELIYNISVDIYPNKKNAKKEKTPLTISKGF